MKRSCLAALAAVALGLGLSGKAAAQGGIKPYQQQPAFSPYLNLNRGGSNPGINYFGLVRPQLQTNQSLQQLQLDVNRVENTLYPNSVVAPEQTTAALVTGHPVAFQNYGRYFPLMGRPPGGGGAGGGGIGGAGYGGGTLANFPISSRGIGFVGRGSKSK